MKIYNQIKSRYNKSECEGLVNGYKERDIKWVLKDWVSFEKKMKRDFSAEKFRSETYNAGIKTLNEIIKYKKSKIFFFII